MRFFILLLTLALVVQAQVGSTHAQNRAADTTEELVVYVSIEPDALEIPWSVATIYLSYSRLPRTASGLLSTAVRQGRFEASSIVDKVQFWGEDPSKAIQRGITGPIKSRSRLGASQLRQYMQIKSKDLRALLAKYRPLLIQRTVDPPYDTVMVNRMGERVILSDRSVHYKMVLRKASDQEPFIEALKKLPGVIGAHGPLEFTLHGATYKLPLYEPNDNYYSYQYNLQDGQTHGTEASEVWPLIKNRQVRVGDGARERVDIAIHEWSGNGSLTDPTVHNDLGENISVWGVAEPFSPHTIGVAGVASAVTNNEIGIAGMAHNSRLQIYIFSESGTSAWDFMYDAIQNGADVINFSWDIDADIPEIRNAIRDAYLAGIFMVASAGNENQVIVDDPDRGTKVYPASYDRWVMAASATDGGRGLEATSNYGSAIDIAAPGESIWTTYINPSSGTAGYTSQFGKTSAASAQVAGAAAMILEVNYSLSPDEVREIIEYTAYPANQPIYFGSGILKADDAVYRALRLRPNVFVIETVEGFVDRIISKDLYVRRGATLDLQGNIELEGDIFVLGELTGSATVTSVGGRLYFLEGSTDNFEGTLPGDGEGDDDDPPPLPGCELPATITADLTIGEACVFDGATVANGATLTIEPGTVLKFTPDKDLIIEPGAKIIADGTSGSKIRFERASSAEPWGSVMVKGNGSTLEYAVFQGGGKALYVAADDVEVRNAVFRDNNYGIYAYLDANSGFSLLHVSESTFEDNTAAAFYTENVAVTAQDNIIRDNQGIGLSVGGKYVSLTGNIITNNQGTGLSVDGVYVFLASNTITSNGYDGIFLQADHASLRGNTISSNGRHGVYLWLTDIDGFEGNVVEYNGGSGIEAFNYSYLYMNGKSRNRIRHNDGHEIHRADATSRLYLGDTSYDAGGFNDIYDDSYGPGNYYANGRNLFATMAENNYWGGTPNAGMFAGSVDYHPYLSANGATELSISLVCDQYPSAYHTCTVYASGGGGDYRYQWMGAAYGCGDTDTCSATCEGYAYVDVSSISGEEVGDQVWTGSCGNGGGGYYSPYHATTSYATLDRVALQKEIEQTQSALQEHSGAAGSAERLHRLYSLLLLKAHVEQVKTRAEQVRGRNGGAEHTSAFAEAPAGVRSLFTDYAEAAKASRPGRRKARGRKARPQKARAAARLILVEDLIRSGQPDRALRRARRLASSMSTAKGRARMHLHRAGAFFQQGKLKQALKAVDVAEKFWPERGGYATLRAMLRRLSGDPKGREAVKGTRPSASQATDALSESEKAAGRPLPEEFALGAPYPNPTGGQVTLPLSLPQDASVRVEVYDLLGRNVRRRSHHFDAGRPKLRIDATGLSSGMYVVQIRVEAPSNEVHRFTEKFTLVR